MAPHELIELLKAPEIVEPFLSRDDSRVKSVRSDMVRRFARGEFVDAWFWAERTGARGQLADELGASIRDFFEQDAAQAIDCLTRAADPLVLVSAWPYLGETSTEVGLEVASRLSDPKLGAFIALRLVTRAMQAVMRQWAEAQRNLSETALRQAAKSQLAPFVRLAASLAWADEMILWDAVLGHVPALSPQQLTMLWEVTFCEAFGERMASQRIARADTGWLKTLKATVAVAALPHTASRIRDDDAFRTGLMAEFVARVRHWIAQDGEQLLNERINGHAILLESLGIAIAVDASDDGDPPRWTLELLQSYDRPVEGWHVDALRMKADASRRAWLASASCVAIRILRQFSVPTWPLVNSLFELLRVHMEDWLWEFTPTPALVRRLVAESTKLLDDASQLQRMTFISALRYADNPTLKEVATNAQRLAPELRTAILRAVKSRQAQMPIDEDGGEK